MNIVQQDITRQVYTCLSCPSGPCEHKGKDKPYRCAVHNINRSDWVTSVTLAKASWKTIAGEEKPRYEQHKSQYKRWEESYKIRKRFAKMYRNHFHHMSKMNKFTEDHIKHTFQDGSTRTFSSSYRPIRTGIYPDNFDKDPFS